MAARFETRELSKATWPDFEQLFSRGNGWDFCWCMAFHRLPHASRKMYRTRAEVSVINHAAKKTLLDQGQAHGILVYADDEPIGWCQFGSSDELGLDSGGEPSDQPRWRITCFVVDKRYRRRGAAGIALRAALDAIAQRGGGLVQAAPVASWSHGHDAIAQAVYVQGVGPVAPAWGGFNNVSYTGTVSMFEKEGFKAVRVVATSANPPTRVARLGARGYRVLMQREVRPR